MLASDQAEYYRSSLAFWVQYDASSLLFEASPFLQAYYSGVALRGSGSDQTRIWAIAVVEYVGMAGAIFIRSSEKVTCTSYHSGNIQFEPVSDRRFPPRGKDG